MNKNYYIPAFISTFFVFAAAFMPWGQIRYNDIMMTGWNGYISLLSVRIPHWTLTMLAITISTFMLLKIKKLWSAPPAMNILFSLYGILHTIILLYIIVNHNGSIGLGSIVTLLSYFALFRLSITNNRFTEA